jgi:hypothetical protein
VKIYGNASPGGPLNVSHCPIPVGTVRYTPPAPAPEPAPLPALATGSRDYVRSWARSHGYLVAQVGALPKKVLDAYEVAVKEAAA